MQTGTALHIAWKFQFNHACTQVTRHSHVCLPFFISVLSALEVLTIMSYIKWHFTYLLYLL